MSHLRFYLPFLTVPFLYPGISASSRLLALLLTGAVLFVRLYETENHSDSTPTTLFSNVICGAITLGCMALYFFPESLWFTYQFWPVAAWGVFLLFSPPPMHKRKCTGFALVLGMLWMLLLAFPFFPALLPDHDAPSIINTAFTMPTFSNIAYLADTKAFTIPPSFSATTLFHATLIATTAFVFILAFENPPHPRSFLRVIPLVVWCILLFLYQPQESFVLLTASALIFVILCARIWLFQHTHRIVFFLILLGLLIIVQQGLLTPVFRLIPTPLSSLQWDSASFHSITLASPASHTAYNFTRSFYLRVEMLAASVLGLLFLFMLIRRDKWNPSFLAGSVMIFVFQCVYFYQSPLLVLCHPLIWFAIILGSQGSDTENLPDLDFSTFKPQFSAQKTVTLSACAILFVLASTLLYNEWKIEMRMQNFLNSENESDAAVLYHAGYYRGDISAIYATSLLQHRVSSRTFPSEDELINIETALMTSIRFNYIPYLAIKRYSDLFFLHTKTEQSIQFLKFASNMFPDQLPLALLLAEQLETIGLLDEAMTEYQHCINLDPTAPHIRKRLALLYKQTGNEERYNQERKFLANLDPTLATDI
jgi:hypothetical protein